MPKKKTEPTSKLAKNKKTDAKKESNEYTIETKDESGKLSFDIDWDRLKIHVQNALTDFEKTSKIKT